MQSHFSIDAATATISFTPFQVQLQKTLDDHHGEHLQQLQQQQSQLQHLQQQLEQLEQQRQQTEQQKEQQNAQRYAEQRAFQQLCAQQQKETEKERYEQKVRLIHSNLTQTTVTFTLSILKNKRPYHPLTSRSRAPRL
jgi:Skp family chaperone for outer membrane proteins